MPVPNFNIFIMAGPQEEKEESPLIKKLKEKKEREEEQEFRSVLMRQLSDMTSRIPNATHAGGG